MSWKHLSTFAIAVLIVANVVFMILVFSEYGKNNYYDQSSIEELEELLKGSNIELSAGVLPKKRTDMRVFKSNVKSDGFARAVTALIGADPEVADGGYSYKSTDGKYEVSGDFSFTYVRDGYEGEQGRFIAVSDKNAAQRVLDTVVAFLNLRQVWETAENKQSIRQPEYAVEKLMVYSGSGALGAHIAEYIDGLKTGNYIDATVIGEEVMEASGNVMFILPEESFKAKNTDVFGVMISEKRRIDALGTGEKYTVVSVGYSLELCFDVFGAAYLMPVCTVGYSDGTAFTYDVISGDRITE